MPKTNTVSAFKCRGTWRSLWFSLNYCQGFISIKLFSSPINFCPSFLLSFHLFLAFMFKCHIIHLNQFWYSLSTVLLCWLSDLLSPFFEPLKCASLLLEVQSGRDTREVLIRLNEQCICAFFFFFPPPYSPRLFDWITTHKLSAEQVSFLFSGCARWEIWEMRRRIQSSLVLHTATVVSTGYYWDHKNDN